MRRKGRKKRSFLKAELPESNEELENPGCGWYHVYPFVLQIPSVLSLEETKACIGEISKKEQLALVRLDIGSFRCREIPEAALREVSHIFELFRVSQKQMIVRFAYDTEGKGMEREPGSIALVKRHMEQLGQIVCRFSEDILVLQGIFVGSWGEMHHSKFLSDSDLSELMRHLHQVTEDRCFLAVRTPAQWRRIMGGPGTDPALQKRMGLFNDGMFGSATDLGTYEEASRQEELEWQNRFLAPVPNGGEALAGEKRKGYRQAAKEMAQMHLSYLNSSYQQVRLDAWKREQVRQSGCWRGLSGYEYIGRHLGYRFVVCKVKAAGTHLEIVIRNRGFANVCEEAACFLRMEKTDGEAEYHAVDTNVSEWESGKKTVLRIPWSDLAKEAQEYRIFLSVRRKRDARPMRFANRGDGDCVFLGTLRYGSESGMMTQSCQSDKE